MKLSSNIEESFIHHFMKTISAQTFILIAAIFIASLGQFTIAQEQGSVSGKIVDANNGEELIGVNVLIEGTIMGAATDLSGNFEIRAVPVGTYNVIASMIGYARIKINEVQVREGENTKLSIALVSEAYETDEVLVTAKLLLNNEAGLLKNRQKSTSISDAISSEQLSRNGSGDAGDALKKVVGSTVVDGKYVFVRGLGQRYSNTMLNGTELPSSDPNKKAFQLDLIPTNLLDNIVTIKTFTPDKPGNFSGGIVDIGTKSFPEKFTLKISSGTSYNSQTTFNNDYLTYEGGAGDWLGSDDGTRGVPELLSNPDLKIPIVAESRFNTEKAQLLNDYSKSFNSVMDVNRKSAPVNSSLSLSIGDKIYLGEESTLGFLGSFTYGRNFSFYKDGKVGRYSVSDLEADILNPQLLLSDNKGTSEANLGGLFSAGYNLNSNQQIAANIFYSRSGISTARYQEGSWPQEFGNDPSTPVYYNRVLHYIERDILSFQLRGEHKLAPVFNSTLNWSASRSSTTQDEPDFRLISSSAQQRANGTTNYIIVGSGFDDPSRYFRNLSDNNNVYSVDLSIPFFQWSGYPGKFKFGSLYQESDREFKERIFSYSPSNALFNQAGGDISVLFDNNNNGIIATDTIAGTPRYTFGNVIKDNSKTKNNYSGDQEVLAYYGMADIPIFRDLRLVGGARFEKTSARVISADTTFGVGRIEENDVLPSANLIYQMSENMNIRLSATETLARPNFRELAPYSTKEFVNDLELQGNPDLKRTLIENYDLRWEWFINPGEILAVSGFYKKLKNPIELSYAPGATASNAIVRYQNVDRATIAGVEFEARLGLSHFSDMLSNFSLGMNLSLIYSNIDISDFELSQRLAIDSSASRTRDLQGQSPYILNVDITYINDEWGTVAGLYFNTFGERLSKVSANVNPDVYEQPAAQLNFNLSQKVIEVLTFNLSVKNILNSKFREVYRYQGQDYVFQEYKAGLSYAVGVSYNF